MHRDSLLGIPVADLFQITSPREIRPKEAASRARYAAQPGLESKCRYMALMITYAWGCIQIPLYRANLMAAAFRARHQADQESIIAKHTTW